MVHFVFFCEFRSLGERRFRKKKKVTENLRGSVRVAFFETVTSNMCDSMHLQRGADQHGIVAEKLSLSVNQVSGRITFFWEELTAICVPRKHRARHTFFAQQHVNACEALPACYSLSVKMTCTPQCSCSAATIISHTPSAPTSCSPSRT